MKYLKYFEKETDYKDFVNGEEIKFPNVSLCKDVDVVYFNPKEIILTSANKLKGVIEVDDVNKNYGIHCSYMAMPVEGEETIDIDEFLEIGVKIEEIKSVKIDGVETEVFLYDNPYLGDTSMICCKINTVGEHNIEIEYEKEFNDRTSLFMGCDLKSIDCSELKINNLNSMFYFLQIWPSGGETENPSIKVEIKGLENIDTSNVHTMSMMSYISNITRIMGLENWNTSNVKYMTSAFSYLRLLTTLDLTNWDLSNVTDASGMFVGCESLIELKMGGPINKDMVVEEMFTAVETNGTFYYNSAYDYSKIIAVLPSTWTAVPCTMVDGILVPNNN